ncbi:MAG: hypothetical protein NT161_02230 [Candidatus Nomurabacteria bacterium]|nr:hypothetical protein [Candidatus Nomurabacteria bacterium]
MVNKILNRILIVGDACRGKSTLASKISKKFGIQNHSTDDFFYEIKFTKKRDRKESINLISKIFQGEKWLIEGTTKHLLEPGLHSADIIIHLKYKNVLTQWIFLIKRYFQRDNETIGGLYKLMKHVLYKKHKLGYRKGKLTPTEIIEPYKDKVITLSSFKEIDEFTNFF